MTTITTRAGKGSSLSWSEVDSNFTNLNNDKAETTAVALKASIDSPTFTGTPTAPTAASGTNTTQIATTAFVNTEITADRPYSDTNPIMDSTAAQGTSPNVSRQDHVHPSDTTKANLASPTFTGVVTTPQEVIGVSATASENHFFDGTTANTLSIRRGTPATPGSEIIKVLSGVLSFPNQDQSLATPGYVTLPGGLIVQWGSSVVSTNVSGNASISFPKTFTSSVATIVVSNGDVAPSGVSFLGLEGTSTTGFNIRVNTAAGSAYVGAYRANWLAVGY